MSQKSPNLPLHNANFGIFIARMVPEIFAFLGTDTARPDFEITTFICVIRRAMIFFFVVVFVAHANCCNSCKLLNFQA
eukprot:UN21912